MKLLFQGRGKERLSQNACPTRLRTAQKVIRLWLNLAKFKSTGDARSQKGKAA